jgi:hypothetical protein
MDTYELVQMLVKMGVFFAPQDQFVIKDCLVKLYTNPQFDNNGLEVSIGHPEYAGAYVPWYSYTHGSHLGHCFHGETISATKLRAALSAAIVTWYGAESVDIMFGAGMYLRLLDTTLRFDPDFKGHLKIVKLGPRKDLQKDVDEHLLKLPFEEVHSWGMPLAPYSGGIHVTTKLNKAEAQVPRISYRDAVANLAAEEKLRFEGEHYKPQKAEPSPFGDKPEGVDDHPWVAWRRNHYSTPVGMKADEYRRALIDVLETEPFRTLNSLSLVNCERERHGHLTLGWVICMYYNFGGKSWEEIHQVGIERIKYDRRKDGKN